MANTSFSPWNTVRCHLKQKKKIIKGIAKLCYHFQTITKGMINILLQKLLYRVNIFLKLFTTTEVNNYSGIAYISNIIGIYFYLFFSRHLLTHSKSILIIIFHSWKLKPFVNQKKSSYVKKVTEHSILVI